MRRESEPGLEYNFESPFLRNVRFCKSIQPKNEAARGNYMGVLPRIVKSSFKVPANWEVVEEFTEGKVLETTQYRYFPGREYVHTCHKPYDTCIRGFWAIKSKELPPLKR